MTLRMKSSRRESLTAIDDELSAASERLSRASGQSRIVIEDNIDHLLDVRLQLVRESSNE